MHAPGPMEPHGTNPAHMPVERRLGRLARRFLHPALADFVMFGLKQAWACLFGGLMLALIIGTRLVWPADAPIARYDALFVAALLIQATFLALRLETWSEAKVIFIFHLVGTAMEIFKIRMGSWAYPEPGLIKIMGVPLFSGFMYACVGSYMARVMRIFDMAFTHFPPRWALVTLAAAIYANFFAHHVLPDIRLLLFAGTVLLFGRTRIYFTPDEKPYWMPLILAALLSSGFVFLAENIGTLTGTWLYKGQAPTQMVPLGKFGSWYLLMFVSFALVTLVHRPRTIAVPRGE